MYPNVIYFSEGDGTFSLSPDSFSNGSSYGLAVGDLDGDGVSGAFVANAYDQPDAIVRLNSTTGDPATLQWLESGTSTSVALGDMDSDGDLDAVVACRDGQPNRLWLNQDPSASSTETPKIQFVDSQQRLGQSDSSDVVLVDWDEDGDLDAVVANYMQPSNVWINDGTGRFEKSAWSFGGSATVSVSLGDLNQDELPDILVGNHDGQSEIWIHNQDGSLTRSDQTLSGSDCFDAVLVHVQYAIEDTSSVGEPLDTL